jgi:hypothetical protein
MGSEEAGVERVEFPCGEDSRGDGLASRLTAIVAAAPREPIVAVVER